MFRWSLGMLATVVATWLVAPASAFAESRVALVIGNASYQRASALTNPANDARAVASLLTEAGFDVTSALDLGQPEMRNAIRDFAAKVAEKGPDSIALIFYAGHGLQMEG